MLPCASIAHIYGLSNNFSAAITYVAGWEGRICMNRLEFMRRPLGSISSNISSNNSKNSDCLIIVNTCTRKLHFIKDRQLYRSYPIAVGKVLHDTKPGVYRILCMEKCPGGRYGARWMGLNKKHYSIHGTDDPLSIGRRVSHGCIRMYNRDVIELYDMVDIGTRVRIV